MPKGDEVAIAAAASPLYLFWAAIVKAMLAGELGADARADHSAQLPAQHPPIHRARYACHGRQHYDPAIFKFSLSISPVLKSLSAAIMVAMQIRGASLKFGPAPPGPNERSVARLLRSMGEQSDAT